MRNIRELVKQGIIDCRIRNTKLFNAEWYQSQTGLIEDVDPYRHYLQSGWKEHDPSPIFSNEKYMEANGDIAEKGLCPLEHYLLRGKREKRKLYVNQLPGKRWRYEVSNTTGDIRDAEISVAEKRFTSVDQQPLVSVIIPTYNRAESIAKSCGSVLAQTYQNIELIVVDDCSDDDTVQVVEGIKDPRIRCIQQKKNQGACVARNTGIEAARGEYIAFQDSDDLWMPDKLKIQMSAMIGSDSAICFCGYVWQTTNGDGAIVKGPHDFYRRGIQNNLVTVYSIGTQTLVFRRDVLLQNRFDPEMPRFQDLELLIRTVSNNRVYYCDQTLVSYQAGEDSISQKDERLIAACALILKKHSDVGERYPMMCRELADLLKYKAEVSDQQSQRDEMIRQAEEFERLLIPKGLHMQKRYTEYRYKKGIGNHAGI